MTEAPPYIHQQAEDIANEAWQKSQVYDLLSKFAKETSPDVLWRKNLENWLKESSQEWRYMIGTGFNTKRQVTRMVSDYQQALAQGRTYSEALEAGLSPVEEDITHYRLEYLLRGCVLPNPIEIGEIDGKSRLKGSRYSQTPLVDVILEKERNGSVKKAIGAAEQFFVGDPEKGIPGVEQGIAVEVSPPGWTGFKNKEGEDLHYPKAQICIMQKNPDGSFESFTIVLDMEIAECQALLGKLGKTPDELRSWGGQAEIENIVKNIATIDTSKVALSIEAIVKMAESVKRNPWANQIELPDGTVETVSFETIYANLQRKTELLNLDTTSAELIEQFKAYVRSHPDLLESATVISLDELAKELAKTILDIKDATEGKPPEPKTADQYQKGYEKLKEEAQGCDPESGEIAGPWGIRKLKPGEKCPRIACQRCPWVANEYEVSQIRNGLIKTCPWCGMPPK